MNSLYYFFGKTIFLLGICFGVYSCKDKAATATIEKSTSVQTKRPNVLLILADDLGVHDLGYTGSMFYETPNIDRIAQEGTVFTQGYANSQVCSPSRASIMTGKSTARHGVTDWIGAAYGEGWRKQNRNTKLLPPNYTHELPKEDISLAEAMQQNGYKTFFAGKWHLGEEGSYPEDHGFSINKGGWLSGSPHGGYFSPWNNPKLPNKAKGENLTLRLASETIDFIEKNKDTNFFAMLSFYAVHGPIQTTQKKWQKYRDKAEKSGLAEHGFQMERVLPIRVVQDNPIYAGLVEQMDDAIGQVIAAVKRLGLEEDTIVIFTSDNGGVASGDAFSTTNLPLRGGKGYQWEGGLREPYIIKVPGVSKPGSKIAYPVTGADLYPTILDLIQAKLLPEQHADGKSLKPLIEGKDLEERSLFWHYPHYGNQGGEPASSIRKGKWKLIYYWEDKKDELYDLDSDPGEQNDLATQNVETREQLHTALFAYLDKVHANVPVIDSLYDKMLASKNHDNKEHVLMPKLEAQRVQFLQEDFEPNRDWWSSRVVDDYKE